MPLISLVYVSLESRSMPETELRAILAVSRKNNQKLGVTGMLLYRDGFFIQALEGEESVVDDLYSRIRRDPRHYNIITVYKNQIEKRVFENWSMGFNRLDGMKPEDLPAFSDFLSEPADEVLFAGNPNRTRALLETFRDQTYF
ncbi:MAG: BLUF domain-containing protein [bacterium]|nr:BLUF domain-containing protein [bacterium]